MRRVSQTEQCLDWWRWIVLRSMLCRTSQMNICVILKVSTINATSLKMSTHNIGMREWYPSTLKGTKNYPRLLSSEMPYCHFRLRIFFDFLSLMPPTMSTILHISENHHILARPDFNFCPQLVVNFSINLPPLLYIYIFFFLFFKKRRNIYKP